MAQALYRKYRSKSFSEVVGQEHITQTLQKAIKSGRVSHAYLFTGPRGVGKTSVARILAHEVNDLPYNDESIHLDIIEIDAASNRRIDEIRDLRDKVRIAPSAAKYKVYIIDEVHMLTREAFNALLKTLEEPPAHCIFILATTEAHKLPQTIISRTQRFEFKSIGLEHAAKHLADIAKREKIDIDKGALDLLAEHGEGSFRDSIGLLDQLAAAGHKITEQSVRSFLGLPPAELIGKLVGSIQSGDHKAIIENVDELREQGVSAATAARLLGQAVREHLIGGHGQGWMAQLLRDLIEVPASAKPEAALEIALLDAAGQNFTPAPHSSPVPMIDNPAESLPEPDPQPKPQPDSRPDAEKSPVGPKIAKTNQVKPIDDKTWEEIIEKVKDQAASLYTALRLATPGFENGKLTLAFQFPLHQKKINQADNRNMIGQIVAQVTGKDLIIEPVVDKTKSPKKDAPKPALNIKPADESLKTISNIFGSAEVLES